MYTNTLEIYVIDKDETILLFIFDARATEGKKRRKTNKQTKPNTQQEKTTTNTLLSKKGS